MRRVAAALCTLLAFFSPQAPVALDQEQHHHLKLENKYVRVFDVSVLPGDETLYHIHANDYLFVSIGDAALKAQMLDGQPFEMNVKDGEVRYTKGPITHRVINPSGNVFRNITVEVLPTPTANDYTKPPAAVDAHPRSVPLRQPLNYVPGEPLVLENDRVRVVRIVLEQGQSIGVHPHSLPELAVAVTDGRILIESPGEKPVTANFKAGDFRWYDAPRTHSLKNIGRTRFEAIAIELK